VAFDPDGEAQKGADNGSNPHNVQGLFVVHSPEDRGKHYSTDGSTGSYEADNASRVFSTYVRDNAKGTSLGTLDHDGRKNESDDSTGQALGEAKKNNHTAFEGKGGELPTKSAAHTIAGIVPLKHCVRRDGEFGKGRIVAPSRKLSADAGTLKIVAKKKVKVRTALCCITRRTTTQLRRRSATSEKFDIY
jgi:hypothetical protein